MVLYSLYRGKKRIAEVVVPSEQKTDRVRIPQKIYNACRLDRLLNRNVEVYRGTELIFNWPARKMEEPEREFRNFAQEQK